MMVDGGFLARVRGEVQFKRSKGEYFACYEFGTALSPDSDEMVRLCTVGIVRLLIRTASFRACYSRLDSAEADALRAKVAASECFFGLELEDTGV